MNRTKTEFTNPNSDKLADEIGKACQRLASRRIEASLNVIEALDTGPLNFWLPATMAIREEDGPISELLKKDSRFPTGRIDMCSYTHQGMFYPDQCAALLIEFGLRSSPKQAIERLLKILSMSHASGTLVSSLWGIKVSKEIELIDNLSLVPLSDLPPSPQRDLALTDPISGRNGTAADMLMFEAPSCAIVARRVIDPLLIDPFTQKTTFSNYVADHEVLSDTALVLTAVGPCCPIVSIGWWQFDDPDLEAAQTTRSRHGQILEILPRPGDPVARVDPTSARAVVSGYFRLDVGTRQKIKLAATRLNRALRRHDVGDRAVEIAIALESLTGDGENNELTHKVKTRCARLLGGPTADRVSTAAIVSATYSIRSKVVHTGHADAAKKWKIGVDSFGGDVIVARAAEICASVIRTIINNGSIPNWREFDLSEHD